MERAILASQGRHHVHQAGGLDFLEKGAELSGWIGRMKREREREKEGGKAIVR
jgi:hypothetical protein